MDMRLQKVLAQAGLASRREAEHWIQAGRISVNGKVVTTLGTQADPVVDRIAVDGKVINRLEPKVYYLLNKPTGYVSTCEDELGRPTVLDLLKPIKFRLFPVGRLGLGQRRPAVADQRRRAGAAVVASALSHPSDLPGQG